MHTPVLLKETIESLQIHTGGRYIDATLGEGGHFREIVKLGGEVLGIDWDEQQVQNIASEVASTNSKVVKGNYADIESLAQSQGFEAVDGVLFDLGLSMAQLSSSKKGFSYKNLDEPLDMRIGNEGEDTAADLLNTLNADSLYEMFAKYSEELDSRIIADAIVYRRLKAKYMVVGDLVETVDRALKNCKQKHQHILNKTLSRIFQSLRIVVNNEFENIRKGLEGALKITKKDGRVAIITFHSLEDRVVKQFIRSRQLKSEEIVRGNPELLFERSATLRVITL